MRKIEKLIQVLGLVNEGMKERMHDMLQHFGKYV